MKSLRKKTGKKKAMLNEPDEFQSLSRKVLLYAQTNTRTVYAALGAVGLVIVLSVAGAIYMDWSEKNLLAAESKALKYYDVNSPSPEAKPMPPADRYKKASELLGGIASGHGRAAEVARYYKANSDMEQGKLDEAVGQYKTLLSDAADDPALTTLANIRLASAYAAKGQTQSALGTYKAMIDSPTGYMKDEAHYRLAGLYERSGDKAGAVNEYKALVKDFPNSQLTGESKQRLAALEGTPPAASAVPAQPVGSPIVVTPANKPVEKK